MQSKKALMRILILLEAFVLVLVVGLGIALERTDYFKKVIDTVTNESIVQLEEIEFDAMGQTSNE